MKRQPVKDYLQVQQGDSAPNQKEETATQEYQLLGIDNAP
jgi:hypothetical protein